jgi:CRISPR-associated endonuclease Csn1
MRNPVVEKMVRETLNLTKEIWKQHGQPDEIHIELGRDLKKNAEERKEISEQQTKNETERRRIIELLKELQGANSESPSDIEKFQLWKDTGGIKAKADFDELFKKDGINAEKLIQYKKNYSFPEFKEPSKSDIEKYRLWVEANHISPYTGKVIPLGKLFSEAYQIEHIIPRSRFFDDSFGNKTICEAEVNAKKDNMLGMEFIE